ncbi:MAG: hypothetical protein AVDCRST_MAG72-1212 [uncultured Nocardioidaceae bacterium]|uniref:Uncharacterized protein n=1 Tax=uncultured Nocardioidaceae bacterium TaxID=253824 RepID=A0A6J4M2P6_9ACTN|nr:MAG: hypothetical protein AVDCRST_MAG72-1212 [uncultured Nocardioidaceae bacterium]
MTLRTARWVAWTLFAACFVLLVLSWVLTFVAENVTPTFDVASSVVLVILPTVGALVASRHPHNVIGWLFLASGLLLALAGATYAYAAIALAEDRTSADGVAAAWLTSWVFLPAIFGVPSLLFLLFPDGRPMTRRWRLVVWLTVVGLVATAAAGSMRPGPLEDSPVQGIENPLGVPGPISSVLENIGWTTGLACLALATVSLILRYRRSRGEQRLQLRWVASSAMVFLLACLVSVALFTSEYAPVGQLLVVIGFSAIPAATGVAILRYRLYDIDLVVNKTLVYGGLTAILVGFYLASVLVLRLLLGPLTGQSDLAVAASTLAVAALFRPLRTRIQRTVDRRFYRRRYDAARTLEGFSGRLRHELDLETLGTDLRGVVHDTMQPAHVSLWLRTQP